MKVSLSPSCRLCRMSSQPPHLSSMESVPLSFHGHSTGLKGQRSKAKGRLSILPISLYCSVELCGYWIPPANLQLSPDPSLVTLIEGISSPLLYVGFGSMESYMVDVAWPHFLATLQEGV